MPLVIAPSPGKTTVGNYFVTDYPPVSCWSADGIPKFIRTLSQEPRPGPLALYVHLPFCRHRCGFCRHSVYSDRRRDAVDVYVDSLLKELAAYKNLPAIDGRPFSSILIGGGSPTILSVDQIRRLISGLQEQAPWNDGAEFTVDCEPGSVTPAKLKALKDFGVTRLSIGFQSLDDEILRTNGRDLTATRTVRAFQQARAAGFDDINIDLVAGLASETALSWRRTLDEVLALEPDCITIFQLELAPSSRMHSAIEAGQTVPLPSWPTKRRFVDEAFGCCEEAGYTVVNGYMAVRDPARWRSVHVVEQFWRGADLLALGEAACGYLQGVHYQNLDTFDSYTQAIAREKLPILRALRMNEEEKLRREVILQLKTGVLDSIYFDEKFGVNLIDHFESQFERLIHRGFVEIQGHVVRLTRRGLLEVDWLLPNFFLPEHARAPGPARTG